MTSRPEVPPRNYLDYGVNNVSVPNIPFSSYNRLPYTSQRLPYGGYSMYGYGSTPYHPSYGSGGYGGYGMNNYNNMFNNPESR